MVDTETDALTAYTAAMERLRMANEEWEAQGFPLTTSGSTGQWTVHPLWKIVNEAEALAAKLRVVVEKKHRGPQPAAVMHPPASARLRKVS